MEIRLFYDRLEVNPLPPTAIALWHALMYLANKSGWPEEISIPVSTLESRSRLERRGVYRARSIPHQAGLISFRERTGNQCAVYKIISLESLLYNYDTQNVPQQHDPEPESSTDLSHNRSHRGDLLYENDTQSVTQTATGEANEDSCGADLSHNLSHKEGVLCENDTQSVTQDAPCCTDLSQSMSPLDKHNISLDKDKEIKKGGVGGKQKTAKSPKKKKQGFDLSFIGDPVWETLVSTWLDYKQSRSEGYKSDLSVKKFHTMLRNLSRGDPQIAGKIIDKSIANNWAGIFELTGRSDDTGKAANGTLNRSGRSHPASGQRIGQIKQPEDEERRRKLLEKFGRSGDTGHSHDTEINNNNAN